MSRARGLAVAAVALPVLLAFAGAAGAGGSAQSIRFGFVPSRAYQGLPAAVTVLVKPDGVTCNLAVRYVDGSLQAGLGQVRVSSGAAKWTWSLAQTAPAGPARATAACGRAGRVSRMFTVVGSTARHSKLAIVKSGFTQRPDQYDAGSTVSYGVLVANPSAEDAGGVTVLVNFVDAANHVLGTSTSSVTAVSASSTFDLGGSASLPTQTAVTRLEVVVQTQTFSPHRMHIPPVQNVQIVAGRFDTNFVGEVDGELVNDDPVKTLTSAQLSIVLFDASGNVVGGGTGLAYASLPPGTRSYFSAVSGFSSVPIGRASTAEISLVPTYQSP
ncbi:MAG TPA: hypothetical protein VLW05_01895 [Gaiellaceae bacterium]|nr:hypothetical protein [Gaiellaceae bacterium]